MHLGLRDLVTDVQDECSDSEPRDLRGGIEIGEPGTDHAEEGRHDEGSQIDDKPASEKRSCRCLEGCHPVQDEDE